MTANGGLEGALKSALNRNCKRRYVVGCLIAATLFPLAIHIAFSVCAPTELFEAKWSAGELLDYVGSIFGAAATIVAVVYTIIEERKGRVEEQRLASVPLITMESPERESLPVDPSVMSVVKPESVGQGAQNVCMGREPQWRYIVVSADGVISYPPGLTEEEGRMAYGNSRACEEEHDGITFLVQNNSYYLPLKLYSTGNGSAVNVSIWLEHGGESPMHEGSPLQLPTVQMPVGYAGYVGVLIKDASKTKCMGDYALVIGYADVMGYEYEQRHALRLQPSVQEGRRVTQASFDFKVNRRLVSKEPANCVL